MKTAIEVNNDSLNKFLIPFLIFLILGFSNKTFAQRIKSTGSVNAAVIYFKLASDHFEYGKYTSTDWPHDLRSPKWNGQFLIPTQFDSAAVENLLHQYPESITSYFHTMSAGKFWLYGDEIEYDGPPLNRRLDSLEYNQWLENNTRVIQWYIDNYDNSYELVFLICRTRPTFGYWGLGRLPILTIYDKNNRPIYVNGIYQTGCYTLRDTRHIVAHEMGHKLGFGHFNGLYRWNLMSGAGAYAPEFSGVTMSAFEKHYLGWLEYCIIDTTTYNIRLSNLTESNEAVRIPIEHSDDYFVIENRQYSEPFEPDPNKTHDYKCTIPGTGLLIYYVDHYGPNIIPADGEIRKVIKYTSPYTQIVYNGDNTDLFGNYGRTEVRLYKNSFMNDNQQDTTDIAIKNIHQEGQDILFDVVFNCSDDFDDESQHPFDFELNNYPNPFYANTKIYYRLSRDSHVKLIIYNLLGQRVMTLLDEFQVKSDYEVVLYGHELPSGIYVYQLKTDYGEFNGKMTLLKNY